MTLRKKLLGVAAASLLGSSFTASAADPLIFDNFGSPSAGGNVADLITYYVFTPFSLADNRSLSAVNASAYHSNLNAGGMDFNYKIFDNLLNPIHTGALTRTSVNTEGSAFQTFEFTLDTLQDLAIGDYFFGLYDANGAGFAIDDTNVGAGDSAYEAPSGIAATQYASLIQLFGALTALGIDLNQVAFEEQVSMASGVISSFSRVNLGQSMASAADVNRRFQVLKHSRPRAGQQVSGGSAGDEEAVYEWRFWSQGDFTAIDRNASGSEDGFESDIYSATIGMDLQLSENFSAGLAYSAVNSDIDYDHKAGSADVNGHYGIAYAQAFFDSFYMNALASYGANEMDLRRDAGASGLAKADGVDSSVYTLQLDAGYEMQFDQIVTGPVASFSYSSMTVDDYTEEGAGAGNLNVDDQDAEFHTTTLGWAVRREGETYTPYMTVAYEHQEFESDGLGLSSTSTGSLSNSIVIGDDNADYMTVDTGVQFQSGEWDATFGYSTQLLRDDVSFHNFSINVGYSF